MASWKLYLVLNLLCAQGPMSVSGLHCYNCVHSKRTGKEADCGKVNPKPCNNLEDVRNSGIQGREEETIPTYQIPAHAENFCYTEQVTHGGDTVTTLSCGWAEPKLIEDWCKNFAKLGRRDVTYGPCSTCKADVDGKPCNYNKDIGNAAGRVFAGHWNLGLHVILILSGTILSISPVLN